MRSWLCRHTWQAYALILCNTFLLTSAWGRRYIAESCSKGMFMDNLKFCTIYVNVSVYIYIYIYMCVCVCMCGCIYIHTYIQTYTQWVYWALSLPIRRPGCEFDHTLPSSADRRDTPILLCIFTSRCWKTHTEIFTLFIYIHVYERNTVNLRVSLLFVG